MRRLTFLAVPLLLAGCALGAGGLSQRQVGDSLPRAATIGAGWELVGTTQTRPTPGNWNDALTDAARHDPNCRNALRALSESQTDPAPARFARSVYRHRSPAGAHDRDLTLTIETFDRPPDRTTALQAMTQACTTPLRVQAGFRTVTMAVSSRSYPMPKTAGYSVGFETSGLEELPYAFDYMLLTQDRDLVTATVTGPSSADNAAVLQRVVRTTATNLERARGATPSPSPSSTPAARSSSATSGSGSPSESTGSTLSPSDGASSWSSPATLSSRSGTGGLNSVTETPRPDRQGSTEGITTGRENRAREEGTSRTATSSSAGN